ncbi:Hypothetical predicted protein, partial [Pelobates cultripes]
MERRTVQRKGHEKTPFPCSPSEPYQILVVRHHEDRPPGVLQIVFDHLVASPVTVNP